MKRVLQFLAWPMGLGVSWLLFWLGHLCWKTVKNLEAMTPLEHMWFNTMFNNYQSLMSASASSQELVRGSKFFPWGVPKE